MNTCEFEGWLRSLGRTHSELVEQGVLPDRPLEILFEGFNAQTCFPLAGVELEFSTDPNRLKCIHVNRIPTFSGEPTYQGALPGQLQQARTRQTAIDLLGAPLRSQPPLRLPEPVGCTGGWDLFTFDDTCDQPVSVMLQYTPDLNVSDLVFYLSGLPLEADSASPGSMARSESMG